MGDFTMPSLGADMEEGTLLEWLVNPGDRVHKGDVVAVVDTAKAAVEVECFEDGVVDTLLVEPGTTVAVGTPLARISASGKPARARPAKTTAPPPVRKLARDLGVDLSSVAGSGKGGRITHADVTAAARPAAPPPASPPARPAPPRATGRARVAPLARRLAVELGVDLAEVVAAAGGQPVNAAMVRAAATAEAPASPPAPDPVRSAIAAVVSRSKREIPHYYLSSTLDLGHALEWMREQNLERPVARRLVPAALLLKATSMAAREVPALNGFWEDDGFRPAAAVHLGVAVSVRGGGLVAPAIHDAADLSLDDLMAALRDLVTRARSGRLRERELAEATLTVTNLGDQGVESVFGVIVPPQVALVGFGTIVRRPWAVGELIGVRPLTTASLSADHRATDGFTGSRFLAAIDNHLQHPETL